MGGGNPHRIHGTGMYLPYIIYQKNQPNSWFQKMGAKNAWFLDYFFKNAFLFEMIYLWLPYFAIYVFLQKDYFMDFDDIHVFFWEE